MLDVGGYYLGFKRPWNQSDSELKRTQKLLIAS